MSANLNHLPPVAANPRWAGCRCVICAREYDTRYEGFVCADCGIDGILDCVYEHDADVAEEVCASGQGSSGLWRFAPLLPIAPEAGHPAWMVCGAAPFAAERLAAHLGLSSLVIKDDTHLPSSSLKDRAAAVAVARARMLGIDHLACASTGNAAASLAVLAARGGLQCTIFVPAAVPRAKLAQLLVHGARVIRVDGTYDQAFDLSIKEIERHGWYSRNCAHNPLLVEGKKTAALELAWDLTDGFTAGSSALPDVVLVPVGDGCIVSSTAKAFLELRELGLTDRVPRVIGVQAAGAAPLAAAWAATSNDHTAMNGEQIRQAIKPVNASTIADSISVGIPRNRIKAWQKVAATGGAFLAVPDEAIIEAINRLASLAGLFAEPSGATGLAGVLAARESGLIGPGDAVAVLVTGHGLKDPGAALVGRELPEPVAPLSGA